MKTIVSRLVQIQEFYHFSDRAFAMKIHVIPQTLGNQLKGRRTVGLETIVAILTYMPEISSDWLLLGVGSMLRADQPSSISIDMHKHAEGGSIIGDNNTISNDASRVRILEKENADLKAENKQLRERCDKLTDKLLAL